MNKRAANLDGRTGGLVTACRPTIIGVLTEEIYMTDLQRCFAQGAKMKVETKPNVDHTPAELDGLSRMLLKAAALIEERGHWRGGPSNDGTCAVLALQAVGTEGGVDYLKAVYRLCESLGLNTKGQNLGTNAIYKWNDSHTKDEVVAKMRTVALGL